jgi:hypothetical protein
MSNEPYWLRLEFPQEAVQIVKDALRSKLYRGTEPERIEKLRALNVRLSAHYEVSACTVEVRQTQIGPHYLPGKDLIVIDRVSLVSWAHELGHHILHSRGLPQNETYPRAFSLGLFYRAAPKLFEAARASGKLMYTEHGGTNAE